MREPDVAERYRRVSRVRGLVLGLALGDALSACGKSEPSWLRVTVTTQLACFTVEGLIRAWVRGTAKGVCHPPSVVWNAYRRWARIQGVDLGKNNHELDGWPHRVPQLHERRGDAPAVVAALKRADGSTPVAAPSTRRGHHALTRLLPVAILPAENLHLVDEMAAATHGDLKTRAAAITAVNVLNAALDADSIAEAVDRTGAQELKHLLDWPTLSDIAPDHSAESALRGGVALAGRCVAPTDIASVLRNATGAGVPGCVGPVAGALLGAVYGVDALPVGLLARLELGWAVDTLARDFAAQLLDSPGPSGWTGEDVDPHWFKRYPGW